MAADETSKAHDEWRKSRERFDYFVVGGSGALCAFVAQTYTPEKIGFTPSTLELFALLILVSSVVAGFKCIEFSNVTLAMTYFSFKQYEEGRNLRVAAASGMPNVRNEATWQQLTADEASRRAEELLRSAKRYDQKGDTAAAKVSFWYRIRNRLLLGGFLLLIAARVWQPYI